jgi:hypothetical protein
MIASPTTVVVALASPATFLPRCPTSLLPPSP